MANHTSNAGDDRAAVEVRSTFADLARQLSAGHTPQETCEVLAQAAVSVIDGCDHAGVAMLSPTGEFTTVSATDQIVVDADALQRKAGEGPCLDASVEENITYDQDLTHAPTWPGFARELVATTPVRAALACPLVIAGRRGGALNLFADRPGAFTDSDIGNAAVLASFASVAVAAAFERERADQLRVALDTNRTIGAAVGILMATHRIGQDDAFALLSAASQRVNRKLRTLAEDIVASGGTVPEPGRKPLE